MSAVPTPLPQVDVDAAQDEEIEKQKEDLALVAEYLRAQNIFIPSGVAAGSKEAQKPPKCSSGAPIWGSMGYRVFPFNGAWFSFRMPIHQSFRDLLKNHYNLKEEDFYLRMDPETKEVVTVKWGEAQGEGE